MIHHVTSHHITMSTSNFGIQIKDSIKTNKLHSLLCSEDFFLFVLNNSGKLNLLQLNLSRWNGVCLESLLNIIYIKMLHGYKNNAALIFYSYCISEKAYLRKRRHLILSGSALQLTAPKPSTCARLPSLPFPEPWPCAHMLSKPVRTHRKAGSDFKQPWSKSRPLTNNAVAVV